MIKKFRKKPVEVEAIQFTSESLDECYKFIDCECYRTQESGFNKIVIKTLEGFMTANEGDWIVKGVEGEFHPVKPGIFEKTYELVE